MAGAGLEVPSGPLAAAPVSPALRVTRAPDGWRLDGRLERVPWAARCDRIVTVAQADAHADTDATCVVIAVRADQARIVPGRNLAGEPRDLVVFTELALSPDEIAVAPAWVTPDTFRRRGALGRAAMMAGAMQRVQELTVRYTNERQQFGRPVAQFQAVAHHLVRIAEEAIATEMAVRIAAAGGLGSEPNLLDVSAAKIVAGQAATAITAAAHQAHGAIGMTYEYELGQLSRRLWAWRDEYGSESHWSRQLGRHLAASGADTLWQALSTGVGR
jgi:acyl-CoA dehydrogenase